MPESAEWPEVHLTRAEIGSQVMTHIDNLTERYLPISSVREKLLSDEAIAAAGEAALKEHSFRPYRYITRTELQAALAAAFPEEETRS